MRRKIEKVEYQEEESVGNGCLATCKTEELLRYSTNEKDGTG
jgi:hypothetical protein